MERYEKYKDSGIPWLGEIPEHWETVALKWISNIYAGGTPDKNKSEYWLNGNIPWLNSGTVNQFIITEPSEYISEEGFSNSSAKWIEEGSLVMALAGQGKTKGMTAFVAFRTTCNQSLAVIQPKQIINSKFLLYFLTRNYFYIRGLAGEGKRDGLNLEIIGSLYIPLFDLEEQKAIAAFLDRKTAEIDKLIAQKERLITLYEEEKTAIINEAVTKGINPDGKLKPSGIDWLGDIPEHWELKRLRHSCSHIFLGLTGKVDYVDNLGFPLVRANNITNGYLDLSQVKFISEKQHRELTKKNKTQKNDILLTKSGSIGTAAIVDIDQEFSIYESIFTLRVKKNVAIPRFLLFFIRSEICKKQYENSIVGMGVGHLNMGDIVDVNMPIPPLEEQKVIAEYIEKETARIDAKIAKTKRIIELQTEYRTALISEAVTGKIKVPNLQGE